MNGLSDQVRLLDATSALIDSHSNFYAGSSVAGLCFGRHADADEWAAGPITCTLGKSNGLAPVSQPIVINEFKPGSNGWVELYNRSGADIDLGGWSVDDVASGGSAPKVIAPNNWITAHG